MQSMKAKLAFTAISGVGSVRCSQFTLLGLSAVIPVGKRSAGEQIRRFKDRANNPLKRWKLSYEDFRYRDAGRTTKSR
jgi:Polyphosphate kinase 2 (PPK2)